MRITLTLCATLLLCTARAQETDTVYSDKWIKFRTDSIVTDSMTVREFVETIKYHSGEQQMRELRKINEIIAKPENEPE